MKITPKNLQCAYLLAWWENTVVHFIDEYINQTFMRLSNYTTTKCSVCGCNWKFFRRLSNGPEGPQRLLDYLAKMGRCVPRIQYQRFANIFKDNWKTAIFQSST